jgi:hypothetical protein
LPARIARARRTPLNRRGWVSLGPQHQAIECRVGDISETGVRILVQLNIEIPQELDLLLTAEGDVHRRCAVVWQSQGELGLRFIGRAAAARRSG